ncbi:hypothetical protein [Thermofilum pendens]|uniref:Uncharacterized protein n=1 Tax=Thermofilum pendens (strain DSM 2475 / Hrk 5) TaxID=368408 RepID=A1RZL1_THEPD|nr:hypothetical protein [Thermofilum pendens]ABL78641.1 hypothetical protein Tpen_1243 [Thermofilum pendens Hrk 5]
MSFYNYDFQSERVGLDNVDWPVSLVFAGFGGAGEVRGLFFGGTPYGNEMKMQVWPAGTWLGDRGTKGVVYSPTFNAYLYLHMRVYEVRAGEITAVGTTHYDQFPVESWSGYTSLASGDFLAMAGRRGLRVRADELFLLNAEGFSFEENHPRLHTGYAGLVSRVDT